MKNVFFNNIIFKDVKEFNIIFLILIGIFLVGISGYSSYAIFTDEIVSNNEIKGIIKGQSVTGAETIIKKVGTDGLVADTHPATAQLQATTDYRYTGANPNNYIKFNNETWRIIGVFDTDDGTGKLEKRIKIIRSSLGSIAWDWQNVSSYTNDWTTATGMTLLNSGDYWNRTGKYASNGLTEEAKSWIADAKWYLGGAKEYDSATNGLVSHFYSYERGTAVYTGRPTSWVGKVGLMYPSDYGYATNGGATLSRNQCLEKEMKQWRDREPTDCATKNWLFSGSSKWTLTPYSGDSGKAFVLGGTGFLSNSNVYEQIVFQPTVYLKSETQITGGNGTEANPYTIESSSQQLGTDTIISKTGTDGLVKEEHPATEQLQATTDYRYTGKNPNNYIKFNNETWRIIGVFDTDDGTGNLEKRIKIISNSIGKGVFNSNNVNDWSQASGMELLNEGDYWNRTGSYASNGLTAEAKLQIANAKWYLGGASAPTNSNTAQFYNYERGIEVSAGNKTSWTGKVGLMYPSDYGYATSGGTTINRNDCLTTQKLSSWSASSIIDCKSNDWLLLDSASQWTLTSDSVSSDWVNSIQNTGGISSDSVSNTYALRPTVYLKSDIKITGGNGTSATPYTIESSSPQLGTEMVIAKAGSDGIVADSHPVTEQLQATTDYRYTGKDPNNYIRFNDEVWRIIGAFDVDTGTGTLEKRLKIIRDSLGSIKWNSTGINDWTTASGMNLLNSGNYYKRTGAYETNGLTEESKALIKDAKWYLGGTPNYTSNITGLASHFYSYERGTTVYSGNKTSWTGKLALMYASDYGYATSGGATTNREGCLAKEIYGWNNSSYSDCKDNDWLLDASAFHWILNHNSNSAGYGFTIRKTGHIVGTYTVSDAVGFRPCTYLKPDVKVAGGDGSSTNPYEISK